MNSFVIKLIKWQMKLKVRGSQPKQMNKRTVLIKKTGIFNTHKTVSPILYHNQEYLQHVLVSLSCTNQPFHNCIFFCTCLLLFLRQLQLLMTNKILLLMNTFWNNDSRTSLWISQRSLWGGTENMEDAVLCMHSSAFLSGWYSAFLSFLRYMSL